jgi:hypothetical protein
MTPTQEFLMAPSEWAAVIFVLVVLVGAILFIWSDCRDRRKEEAKRSKPMATNASALFNTSADRPTKPTATRLEPIKYSDAKPWPRQQRANNVARSRSRRDDDDDCLLATAAMTTAANVVDFDSGSSCDTNSSYDSGSSCDSGGGD